MTTSTLSRSSILISAWVAARAAAAAAGEGVRLHIGAAMRAAWAAAKEADAAMADFERLDLLLDPVIEESEAAVRHLDKCRAERIAVVAGKIDICLGVALANEDRACVAFDEVFKRRHALVSEHWNAFKRLNNEQAAQWRTAWRRQLSQSSAMVHQQAQQQQSRDLRRGSPEPREIRITALGRLGLPCDPDSPGAALWIVTDGLMSRDCASLQEAEDLAEDFRGWGYVVPAH